MEWAVAPSLSGGWKQAEMNALEVDVVLIEMMMSFWCNTMRLEDASRRRRRRRWGEERGENGAGNQLTR